MNARRALSIAALLVLLVAALPPASVAAPGEPAGRPAGLLAADVAPGGTAAVQAGPAAPTSLWPEDLLRPAVVAWTGAAGDGAWSNPRNWAGGRVPGPTDTARFAGRTPDARVDAAFPGILSGLVLAADYAGTVRLERALVVRSDLVVSGGALQCGTVPLDVGGVARVSGGLLVTPAGATMNVVTLDIASPGVVRLGPEGKLNLSGAGQPLTGDGLLDTTTYRPNSVEYTGRATADLTAAGPAVGLRQTAPEGFGRVGSLLLSTAETDLVLAVIDPAAGFAYFGTWTYPGIVVKVDVAVPSVAIVKTVAPASARPGEAITYTLAFENAGIGTAPGVRITDTIPVSVTGASVISSGVGITHVPGTRYVWQVEDLAPGDSGVITISGVLTGCLPAGHLFTNTAIITAAGDGTPANNRSAVAVTVLNAAPLAYADAYSTTEDAALVVSAPGVLGNDGDTNCDPLTATLATPPVSGTVDLHSDGSFVYTPTLNFYGLDSFTYVASEGALTATATVLITVTAVNDAPLAADNTYISTEDTLLLVTPPGVLGNDSDPDDDPLTPTLATPPPSGTVKLHGDGSFAYTPTLNWNGLDSFTYVVSDGALTDTAAVSITITAVNDAPAAADDAYTTTRDSALVVPAPGVLGNDSDVEDDPLSAALDTPPAHGVVALHPDGSFTYTPTLGFLGVDTFVYALSDGALTDTATVTITVIGQSWSVYLPLILRND